MALLVSAGLAQAGVISTTQPNQDFKGQVTPGYEVGGGFGQRADVVLDISGRQTFDPLGDSSNTVVLFDFAVALGAPSGTPVSFNGIGWDTFQEALGLSWLSEMRIAFGPSSGPVAATLRTGAGNNPGTGSFSNPVIDFSAVPLPNVSLPDGILRIEFFDSFDDAPDAVDGIYTSGSTLTLRGEVIPTPAGAALLGLGGLLAARRRRA